MSRLMSRFTIVSISNYNFIYLYRYAVPVTAMYSECIHTYYTLPTPSVTTGSAEFRSAGALTPLKCQELSKRSNLGLLMSACSGVGPYATLSNDAARALMVPGLQDNLISVAVLCDAGHKVEFTADRFVCRDADDTGLSTDIKRSQMHKSLTLDRVANRLASKALLMLYTTTVVNLKTDRCDQN